MQIAWRMHRPHRRVQNVSRGSVHILNNAGVCTMCKIQVFNILQDALQHY
jgi:hypothetical protein